MMIVSEIPKSIGIKEEPEQKITSQTQDLIPDPATTHTEQDSSSPDQDSSTQNDLKEGCCYELFA